MLKLNGGLGTGMGLDFAKSLLKVKGNDTFLDLTAKQVISMRKAYKQVKMGLGGNTAHRHHYGDCRVHDCSRGLAPAPSRTAMSRRRRRLRRRRRR